MTISTIREGKSELLLGGTCQAVMTFTMIKMMPLHTTLTSMIYVSYCSRKKELRPTYM